MALKDNVKAFTNSLIKEADSNPEYRQKLISNPKAVIENRLNFRLPEEFEVMVYQNSHRRFNIVLPMQSEELSELELAAVAGGACYTHVSCPGDTCYDYVP